MKLGCHQALNASAATAASVPTKNLGQPVFIHLFRPQQTLQFTANTTVPGQQLQTIRMQHQEQHDMSCMKIVKMLMVSGANMLIISSANFGFTCQEAPSRSDGSAASLKLDLLVCAIAGRASLSPQLRDYLPTNGAVRKAVQACKCWCKPPMQVLPPTYGWKTHHGSLAVRCIQLREQETWIITLMKR